MVAPLSGTVLFEDSADLGFYFEQLVVTNEWEGPVQCLNFRAINPVDTYLLTSLSLCNSLIKTWISISRALNL